MALTGDTVTEVIPWPVARKHLGTEAVRLYRLASRAPSEYERGRLAGQAEQCETLMSLPETLKLLEDADEAQR